MRRCEFHLIWSVITVGIVSVMALGYVTRPMVTWSEVVYPEDPFCIGDEVDYEVRGRIHRDGVVRVASDWKEVPVDGGNSIRGTASSVELPVLRGDFIDSDARFSVPDALVPGTYRHVVVAYSLTNLGRPAVREHFVEVMRCGD